MAGEIRADLKFDGFQRGGDAGDGVFKFQNGKRWYTWIEVEKFLVKRFHDVRSLMTDGEHLEISIVATLPEKEEDE